jgi:glycosyltransferase involved in cell wall biosynthesis
MKVLHFTQTLPGGPATFLNELLAFQTKTYERVALLCPAAQQHLVEVGPVEILPLARAGRTPSDLIAMHQALREHLGANAYDVIHLHSSFAGAIGRLAPGRRGARVVYCAHGWAHEMDVRRTSKLFYATAERMLSSMADIIINISESEQRHAAEAGIPKSKCKLIYNGIREAPWTPLEGEEPARRLLFVGRYDRQKGLDVLVHSMRELAAQDFRLTAIGASVIGQPVVTTLPAAVRDLGWRSSEVVREEMRRCDLVVVPSRWEGFGLVAVEAMRAGRAVVATNIGGLPEIVVDGETGVLCAPGSPRELTMAIRRAAPRAREMGIAARARYERLFTAERMFRETHAAYVQ